MKVEEIIIGPQLIGVIFMLTGWIQFKYPPKKINGLYGYRTDLSMKNQRNWDEGNRFSSHVVIRIGLWLTLGGFALSGLFQFISNQELRLILMVPGLLLAIAISVIILTNKTERHLEKFEKDNA